MISAFTGRFSRVLLAGFAVVFAVCAYIVWDVAGWYCWPSSSVRIQLHLSDGLSIHSPTEKQIVRLDGAGPELYVLITNVSNSEIHLWDSRCLQGAISVKLEFLRDDSDNIEVGRIGKIFSGSSSVPSTLRLASSDDLIIALDLSEGWELPLGVVHPNGFRGKVRVVYESSLLPSGSPLETQEARNVWAGSVKSLWQHVIVF